MSQALFEDAALQFEQQLGVPLDELLQAIDPRHPAGYCAKSAGVHQAIQGARRRDDPSLPQGPWQHELKRADWAAVSATAADTLRRKSKDLQLAAWLLEAQIHQCGFAGIAPSLLLIEQLLRRFGHQLHPQEAGGGTTHRANVLRWINRKLQPVLKQLPLTAAGTGRDYGWADRESAWRGEQHKQEGADAGAVTLQALQAAMGHTASAHFVELQRQLRLAVEATLLLTEAVDDCFQEDPPSLGAFGGLLRQMLEMVEAELHRRGLLAVPAPVIDAASEPSASAAAQPAVAPGTLAAERAHAYALLEQAANTLIQTDPHSPAPYLVQRAVQWGRLSTSELYQEVFIRMGGQLNIFELLGLQAQPAQAE